MPELIPLGYPDDFATWWLVNALSEVSPEKVTPRPDGKLEVSLVINGCECPVLPTLRCMESQMERMIQEKAEELIREKLEKDFDAVGSVLEFARQSVLTKFAEAGFKLTDEEE